MSKNIMNVSEVARYLGFSTKKIYRLAEERKIPATRVGRQYRFIKRVIDDWLKGMSISSLGDIEAKNMLTPALKKGPDEKSQAKRAIILLIVFSFAFNLISAHPLFATRTEINAHATVMSFGAYSFEGTLAGDIRTQGICELGGITVKGTYNGPYPWTMRIYTDNLNYKGIGGGFENGSLAGLVSKDGKYVLPLWANCPNWGIEEWLRIPDLNDPGYKTYAPSSDVGTGTHTERIIMGIDPRNADWVSGPDRVLFTADDNMLGDITLETPFEIKFRTKVGPNTPMGNYEGRIYIEIVPAP